MEWQETGLVLLAACTVLLLPGLAVCAAAGARSILLLGMAGPVSVSIIGLGAVVFGLMDRPLTAGAVVVATVVAAVPILVLRLAMAGPSRVFAARRPTGATAAKALAAAVACGFLGARLLEVFQRPDSISQTLDNIFHLNLARFFLDTGSGSSLEAGQLTDPGAGFEPYPAAWHDVVALVAEASGASVPVAATSANLVIGAVLWPFAVMLLGTVLAGDRPAVWLLSGLLSGAFAAFPYLMLDFGVLYPNFLSLALLPALLALTVSGTRRGSAGLRLSWFLFLLALPGLGLAHPSSLVALAALSLPMGVRAVRAIAGSRHFSRRLAAAGTAAAVGAAYGAVVYAAWTFLRPEIEGIRWEARMNPAQAFGEGILNAPLNYPVPVLVAVLTALGVGSALRSRRDGWVIGVLGIGVGLYTVADGFPWSDLRTALVGSWYNDPARLAALLPAAAMGAVILGATAVVDRAASLTRAAARAVRRGSGPRRVPSTETEPADRQAVSSRGAARMPDRGMPEPATSGNPVPGRDPSLHPAAPSPGAPVPRWSTAREPAAGRPTAGMAAATSSSVSGAMTTAAAAPGSVTTATESAAGAAPGAMAASAAAERRARGPRPTGDTPANMPRKHGARSGRPLPPSATPLAGRTPPGPRSRRSPRPRPGSGAALLVGFLCAGALGWAATESAAVDRAVRSAAHSYDTEENGRLLDRDEQALLSRLGETVPEDAVVVGNPWTGTALVYALADRAALTPHVFWTDTADSWLIMNQLDEAVPGGEVCAAIERTGAYYALDFGTAGVHGEAPDPPGLDNLADNPSVQLVDQVGQARLYRVAACGDGS